MAPERRRAVWIVTAVVLTAGGSTAVNIATNLKNNPIAWMVVAVLTGGSAFAARALDKRAESRRKINPPVIAAILERYGLSSDSSSVHDGGQLRRERLRGVTFRQETTTDVNGAVRETTELFIEEISYVPIRRQGEKDAR